MIADGGQQGGRIAAREIYPTHRLTKQDVATEHHPVPDETDAARRVPRGMPHLKLEPPHCEVVVVMKIVVRGGYGLSAQAEPRRLLGNVVVQLPVVGMEIDRRSGGLLDGGHAGDVVDVGVGQPDAFEIPPPLPDDVEELVSVLTRVDDDGIFRVRISYQIAVLLKLPIGKANDDRSGLRGSQAGSRTGSWVRSLRYFSMAITAVVASPTAVVIWRVTCTRKSPAAYRPGMDVCMVESVIT